MEKQSFLKSLLFLDRIYMPKIINVLYILSVIASIAGGIFLCFCEMPDISIVSYNIDFSEKLCKRPYYSYYFSYSSQYWLA